ncbi:unnamed protein product [Paramecium octaurelia]|uniref:Uncharacterized protein n=1 Tax=Paramecium octaurelia TaxID=43137 RepID=A0A8S1VCG9_PAROT|nr:unnamed protein product [Paramecium octaurelia]
MKNKIIWFLIINVKLVRKKLSNVLFQLIVVLNARLVFFRGFEQCCFNGYYLNVGDCLPCPIQYSDDCTFQSEPEKVCFWIHNMSINIVHIHAQHVQITKQICHFCESRYYLEVNKCKICSERCFACSVENTYLRYQAGYYLQNYECMTCGTNIYTCFSENYCYKCQVEYQPTNSYLDQCYKMQC